MAYWSNGSHLKRSTGLIPPPGGLVRGWRTIIAFAFLAISFGYGVDLAAQEAAPKLTHPEAKEAIKMVRSPFCPGLMLEVCPTLDAEQLRDTIDAMANRGLPADSLVELIIADLGEEYRALPKKSGTGLLAWVMPPLALILGLGLVFAVLRRAKLREPEDIVSGDPISSESEALLAAALADLEDE